ncbi:MAG TPA: D-amino-acid transaminase [Xanthobacteraceae bacterium]|jgi:D-alanine transaminase|nr:D-amino-acid transaminase [Xanthobacteraceae bacterium]
MSRIAYVNGRYLPLRDAKVHVEDRGYQFSDGVYEVCEVRDGRLIDERRHLERLQRSLSELRIHLPISLRALDVVLHETVRRNRIGYGIVYLQITRGVARRDHAFPTVPVEPSIVVTARPLNRARNEALAEKGIAVVSVPDNRWGRVDIKTIGLLPNVLARQAAIEQGARDAWFVDRDGAVTEAASANAWIVTAAGTVVTRPADHAILRGITRTVLLDVIKAQGLRLEERAFTLKEAYAAREAFITSASQIVLPVVRIDDHPIGNGAPGLLATALRREFHRFAEAS